MSSSYENYEPTTYPWNIITSLLSFFCIVVSFFSPYWLVNTQPYGESPFLNLGLWTTCFHDYHDLRYLYDRVYNGCYWNLSEEMHVIDYQMKRPFFVAVQTLFTLVFVLAWLSGALTLTLLCSEEGDEQKGLLKLSSAVRFVSFALGGSAVLVFAVLGDSRDWMPHWEHNYIHWAFAIAAAGVVLELIAAVLLLVEYRIVRRGENARHSHGMFLEDTKV